MNSISDVIVLPSLKALLVHRLQNIFAGLYSELAEIGGGSDNLALVKDTQSGFNHPVIPLNQIKNSSTIWYVSAIALKFAADLKTPPGKIADAIAQKLKQPIEVNDPLWGDIFPIKNYPYLCTAILQSAVAWTTDRGWVYWQLTAPGIELWVRWMVAILMVNPGIDAVQFNSSRHLGSHGEGAPEGMNWINASEQFELQYTHARCHSLLRLAMQEQVWPPSWVNRPLPVDEVELAAFVSSASDAMALWRSPHPTEIALLSDLVATVDLLQESLSLTRGLQIARGLSQRFNAFYAACPLFGETELAIAQSRLELVLITRSLLHILLHDYLGCVAPISL